MEFDEYWKGSDLSFLDKLLSRKEFCEIVSSLEKVVRDSKQLVKVGSPHINAKQLKLRVGVKPTLEDCLEGLRLLEEMHQSE